MPNCVFQVMFASNVYMKHKHTHTHVLLFKIRGINSRDVQKSMWIKNVLSVKDFLFLITNLNRYNISNYILVSVPPEKPQNLTCIVHQAGKGLSDTMLCTWNPGRESHLDTRYTLKAQTYVLSRVKVKVQYWKLKRSKSKTIWIWLVCYDLEFIYN